MFTAVLYMTSLYSLQYAVQAIWKAVRDLLQPQQPSDVRQAVLRFTRSLVAGQYSELGVMRAHFFKVIQTHRMEEDAQQRSVMFRNNVC